MKGSSLAGQKWQITKVVLAIIALIICVYQVVSGINLMNVNNNPQDLGREITSADYANLSVGETVYGKVNNIIMQYQGEDSADGIFLNYYLVKSDDNKLITFRTEAGSNCDSNMQSLLSGQTNEVMFRGYVKDMMMINQSMLNLQRIATNTLSKNNIKGSWNEILVKQVVDITDYNAYIDDKIITATFIGAGIMLLIAFLLLRKVVKNAIYSIYEAKGNTDYEVNLKPEKKLETEEFFKGGINNQGYFYVGYEQEEESDKDNLN